MFKHSYKTVKDIDSSNMVNKCITYDCSYSAQFYNCLPFGERGDANRVAIQLSSDHNNGNVHIQQFESYSTKSNTDIYGVVDCVDNTKKYQAQ